MKIQLYDWSVEQQTSGMPAYVLADLEVLDAEGFETYKQMVPATIAQYGGRYIVRGGKIDVVEGTWSPKRLVILEFPSMEKAKAWMDSAEYAQPKALRRQCARTQMLLVEGL